MDVLEAIRKRRSIRSFGQDPVPREYLSRLADAARLAPMAVNLQPLEFLAVTDPVLCEQVFGCLKWAALTFPKGTPDATHRPTAYLCVAVNQDLLPPIGAQYDVGAAVENILLAAVGLGLGSCWIKSVNYPKVTGILGLPDNLKLDSVVALGHPAEEPIREDLPPEAEGKEPVKYYRDGNDLHHVPKRALEAVLSWNRHGIRR